MLARFVGASGIVHIKGVDGNGVPGSIIIIIITIGFWGVRYIYIT